MVEFKMKVRVMLPSWHRVAVCHRGGEEMVWVELTPLQCWAGDVATKPGRELLLAHVVP